MSKNNLKRMRQFEKELDEALDNLACRKWNGEECLRVSANFVEVSYKESYGITDHLRNGLRVLAPYFVTQQSNEMPDADQLIENLVFSGYYYILREYLYYTYNAPGSFNWIFSNSRIEIKFADPTIPRQFFIESNNHTQKSIQVFSNWSEGEFIRSLLKGTEEFSVSARAEQAMDLIFQEVDLKLKAYFNFVGETAEIKFESYSYSDFYQLFRVFLAKSLYHRYHSQVNGSSGTITPPFQNLVKDLVQDTGLADEICSKLIKDISYHRQTQQEKIQPMYFSLFYLADSDQLLVLPYDFALWEGFINFLRIVALRQPKLFLEKISTQLSDNFLNHIEKMFLKQGFKCLKNVQLNRFDSQLPDIDLLVISEEPTLGYFLFCCEVKSPIPPVWAKDQLRVLSKDSVAKAFKQLDLIMPFLNTPQGINFLRSMLPKEGLPYFGDQFAIVGKSLIITSGNAGMFFDDKNHWIINHHTLDLILENCDGDVTYILHVLENINSWSDQCFEIRPIELDLNKKIISFEGVRINKWMGLSPNKFKSIGMDKTIAQDFINEGLHPFDVFEIGRITGEFSI